MSRAAAIDTRRNHMPTLRLVRGERGDMDTEIIRQHLTSMRLNGLSDTYIYNRERQVVSLSRALPVPLLEATPPMLLDWRAGLRLTPAGVAGYVSHANRFYQWAVDDDRIAANPAARLPVPKRPRRVPRPIPDADLLAALDAADARMRVWLVLMAWCGLRAVEVTYLRAENIMLRACPPILIIAADATKGTRERVIEICPFAAGEIAAANLPAAGWTFRRRDGRPGPNEPWHVSHLIARFLHSLGITATGHQLRHWFATEALRANGGKIRPVQELLGHASPESTAIYTEILSPEREATVAALPVPSGLRLIRGEG